MRKLTRPSHGTIVAYAALFVALGGSAAALSGKNSVFSDDIKNKEVKARDLAPKSVKGNKVRDGSLSGVDIGDGSLSAEDVDATIPRSGPGLGDQGPFELNGGAINFIGYGADREHVTDIAGVGKVLLSCDYEVGAQVAFESTVADDMFVLVDPGDGDGEWGQLATGETIPPSGDLPSGGSGEDGAAHVELQVLGLGSGASPYGQIDLFIFNDQDEEICFVLASSRLRT